jgi:hypothetical protein
MVTGDGSIRHISDQIDPVVDRSSGNRFSGTRPAAIP